MREAKGTGRARRSRVSLLLCAFSVVLAGCSEKAATPERPRAQPVPSDTHTPSPSPSPTLPEPPSGPSSKLRLKLVEEIGGYISPKSIVASQNGLFFFFVPKAFQSFLVF